MADLSIATLREQISAGASDYITKPIDVRRFLEIVDGTLGGGLNEG